MAVCRFEQQVVVLRVDKTSLQRKNLMVAVGALVEKDLQEPKWRQGLTLSFQISREFEDAGNSGKRNTSFCS